MDAELFKNTYIITTFLLFFFTYVRWMRSGTNAIFYKTGGGYMLSVTYAVVYAICVGLRALDGGYVDTVSYNVYFTNMEEDYLFVTQFGLESDYEIDSMIGEVNFLSEWLWKAIIKVFIYLHLPAQMWFLFIASCYMGFTLAAFMRIFRNNHLWIAFFFFIGSFTFLNYSYNTIRSGAAGAVCLYALSYLIQDDKKDVLIGYIIAFIAVAVHRSMAIPVASFTMARFLSVNFKTALWGWISAIAISVVAGTYIQSLVSSLGLDNRSVSYLSGQAIASVSTRFRFDFLLYSAMPIVFAYYVIIKKNICDKVYTMLIVTYLISNAFWVLVIRMAYTDRVAYLSWFMYPLVMSYPLLKLDIWPKQVYKIMNILLLYVCFTLCMCLLR